MNLRSIFQVPALPVVPWEDKVLRWSLEDLVLSLETLRGNESLTLADVLRGVQIFGTTGSGKTSGAGRAFAVSYLKSGFGGLVLCVKADEATHWKALCEDAGRSADVVHVSADGNFNYNFLDHEMANSAGPSLISNVTNLLLDVSRLSNREKDSGGKASDAFWDQQLGVLISKTIILVKELFGSISPRNISILVRQAEDMARTLESTNKLEMSDFEKNLRVVFARSQDQQVLDSVQYFLTTFRRLPEKTRATIIAMLESVINPLTEYPLEEMFSGESTVGPEDAFKGKIIIIDVPVHTFKSVGQLAQSIWKNVFMNAVKARIDCGRPVFLWADESQYFAEKSDVLFLTTVRSKRCSVVYLTQNIPNYEMKLRSKEAVDAILGSLNIRIFHQNNDPKTNAWATESIGKVKVSKKSVSQNEVGLFSSAQANKNISLSDSFESDVPERLFTNLSEGGIRNGLKVEAIMHVAGRRFRNGKTWGKVVFKQG